jgi:hypothetical protein
MTKHIDLKTASTIDRKETVLYAVEVPTEPSIQWREADRRGMQGSRGACIERL